MSKSFMIEAGAAFGSGGHPSTALALWLMGQIPPKFTPSRILDLGCGSGILSVAGALRWHCPVIASDLATEAVAQTQANARTNKVEGLIRVLRADGCRHPDIARDAPYPLVMSNMLADLHIKWARDMVGLLKPEGLLLLSGILRWRLEELLAYYHALGMEVVAQEHEGDWVALLLRKERLSHPA